MIIIWKKIDFLGILAFSIVLFKLGKLKKQRRKKLWKTDIVYRW